MSEGETVVRLATTQSDAEIAADLKARLTEALKPVCALFDEAAQHGLIVQWDAVVAGPPYLRHDVRGLRLVKHF